MKLIIFTLSALLTATCAIARIAAPFQGWDQLEEESPYIIIAFCGEPTPPTPGVLTMNVTKSDSNIKVISFLKGTNNVSSARLLTDYSLQQGENYLVFGYYDSGVYQAYEEYRVIPLGASFSTNLIAGKPLDDQVQFLLQRRLDSIKRQMMKDQEEMQRLDEALKKQASNAAH